jgi:hypothetical protein
MRLAVALGLFSVVAGCRNPAPATGTEPRDPATCEREKQDLIRLLGTLPERPLTADFARDLPSSTLGSPPRAGSILEVSETTLALDGKPVDQEAVAGELAQRGAPKSLYLAAAPDTTIERVRSVVTKLPQSVELSLLVRSHDPRATPVSAPGTPERAQRLAEGVLAERDPNARRALLSQGYEEFSTCPELAVAVKRADQRPSHDRWPLLRVEASAALPACSCDSLWGSALATLFAAEQRAGVGTLAALPFSFVRDERCGATMRLRSVRRLLEQIEEFDAEWAGKWQDDALRFEQVITNDRLLVQFCDALPGETLAALERARGTIWLRAPGREECDAWSFEPLSPGAPMGTLRRGKPGAWASPSAAFHYWQAAEEISVFGPLVPGTPSKPTDERTWPCRVNHRLTGIDAESIALEEGRFFFNESACRAGGPSAAVGGCATTSGTVSP